MVLVKICGLMHSEDILAVNTAGADFAGFLKKRKIVLIKFCSVTIYLYVASCKTKKKPRIVQLVGSTLNLVDGLP